MAGSPTDVCNLALTSIGEQRIGNVDDDNSRARACKLWYGHLASTSLRFADWAFCKTQAELAQINEVPLYEYTFAYQLPVDCMMIRRYQGDLMQTTWTDSGGTQYVSEWPYSGFYGSYRYPNYKVFGDKLYTHYGRAFIDYTRDVSETPGQWDIMFTNAVITLLAGALAGAISKDMEARATLTQLGEEQLREAAAVSSQEHSIEAFSSPELLAVR